MSIATLLAGQFFQSTPVYSIGGYVWKLASYAAGDDDHVGADVALAGQLLGNFGFGFGSDKSIVIDSGDSFWFDVDETNIVSLFGQTVSYVTGENNQQSVVNGFSVTKQQAETPSLAPLGENTVPTVVPKVADVGSAVSENEDDGDQPAIVINSGDTFVFLIDEVSITKMFGQTVSYVSGSGNSQSVINGAKVEISDGAEAAPVGEGQDLAVAPQSVAEPATSTADAEMLDLALQNLGLQQDYSDAAIVIDSGDKFYFDVGDVAVTKLFGQTVSYTTGENNVQEVVNGPSYTEDLLIA